MRKSTFLITCVLSILSILAVTPTALSWEGYGGGTVTAINVAPRIVSVTFDKTFLEPGGWVTITVRAVNDGPDTAPFQTIHIGLPFDPPSSDVVIVSTDLSEGAKVYPKGSTLSVLYGRGQVTSKYPIVEGLQKNWPPGTIKTLVVKVKLPDVDTVAFDIKTVAADASWNVLRYYPSSGMVDQQGEYVSTYLLLRKFAVSLPPGGTADVNVNIVNHNRYPPSGAPAQPSMKVDSFTVTDYGGFKGSITALNLGLSISPGSTNTLKVRVSAASDCPRGTYTIQYKVSGSP
jgi:hypothetical protein